MFNKVCLCHLRQIRTIRRSCPPQTSITLVHALICSRTDFGNMSSVGLGSSCVFPQLQSVLDAGARLIDGIPKFGHISTLILQHLHWLPIRDFVFVCRTGLLDVPRPT